MTEGTSFVAEAAQYGFGLGNDDDGNQEQLQRASTLRWDRKNKRIVQGTGIGADNKKLIKTESGTRLPASFRSGKFEEWKQKHRTSLPRIGDIEKQSAGPRKGGMGSGAASRWRHKSGTPGEAKASADTKGRGKQRSSMAKASLSKKPSNGLRNYDQIAKERKLKAARYVIMTLYAISPLVNLLSRCFKTACAVRISLPKRKSDSLALLLFLLALSFLTPNSCRLV